jgi:hypothetical protein
MQFVRDAVPQMSVLLYGLNGFYGTLSGNLRLSLLAAIQDQIDTSAKLCRSPEDPRHCPSEHSITPAS